MSSMMANGKFWRIVNWGRHYSDNDDNDDGDDDDDDDDNGGIAQLSAITLKLLPEMQRHEVMQSLAPRKKSERKKLLAGI